MGDVWTNLLVSAQITLPATLLVTAAGLPLAWALARPGWRGRRVVDVVVNLPVALPPTVLGYYLLLAISRSGPIGRLTEWLGGSTLIFTVWAAILASCVVCLPLFVQAARNALEGIPEDVYEAAQIDGAGRWSSVRHIILPLAWPGIWTGVLLAFARSLGEFGTTLMVAGNIPGKTQSVSLAIYEAVQSGDDARANTLALVLISVAATSMWIGLRWRRGGIAS